MKLVVAGELVFEELGTVVAAVDEVPVEGKDFAEVAV